MIELLGKKYYDVFRAGEYPQATVTVEMLQRVASSYDTKFHFAPVWLGHPSDDVSGKDEPEALGWVGSVILLGDLLYVSFADVSDEMAYLVAKNKFKFVSIELRYLLISSVQTEYLYAMGLTNRPAVKGLTPLEFPKTFTDAAHAFNTGFLPDARLTFEAVNNFSNDFSNNFSKDFTNNFSNQNQNIMNQFLIDTAKAVGLDVAKFTTESALADAVKKVFTDSSAKIATLTIEVNALKAAAPADPAKTEFTDAEKSAKLLAEKVATLENLLFTQLVDGAITAKKLTPAQREYFISSARANYDGTKNYIDSLPALGVLDTQTVKDGFKKDDVNLQDPKFKNKDGIAYTYSELLKKENANVLAQFSESEILAIRAKDPVYGKAMPA